MVILLLLASAALIAVVTVGGWPVLQGGQFIQIAYALIYIAAAVMVGRWNRGTLPVASALALILIIVAAVAAPGWFTRDKTGFEDPYIAASLLGLLTLLMIPLQVLVIVFALRGFGQNWNVEA